MDFQGDLYGRPIEIDFFARLRDIKRFDSAEQLIEQMALDVRKRGRSQDYPKNSSSSGPVLNINYIFAHSPFPYTQHL